MRRKLTAEEIEAGRSPRGGWTKRQLKSWGVPWPPPKGWKTALMTGKPIPGKRKRRHVPRDYLTREYRDIIGPAYRAFGQPGA